MKVRTKKCALAVLLGIIMLFTCALTGIVAFAAEQTEPPAATEVADKDWSLQGGNCTATYNLETGFSTVHNFEGWGYRMAYNHKVKLDGLTLELYNNTFDGNANQVFGFGLAKEISDSPFDKANAFCGSFWPNNAAAGQTQLNLSRSHNPGDNNFNPTICFKTPEEAANAGDGGGTTTFVSSIVYANIEGELGAKLEFAHVAEPDCWSVKITITAGERHAQQTSPTTVYFNNVWADSVLDADGNCYIVATGFGNTDLKPDCAYKIEDDNVRNYRETVVATVNEAASEYENSIDAVSDLETFNASIEKRDAFVAAIGTLRGNDTYSYNARLAELDKKYTQDETIQSNVKAVVQEYFNATDAKIAVLGTESAITDATIKEASDAYAAEKQAFENVKNMLTEQNQTEFTSAYDAHVYAVELAKAKLWIIDFETKVAALENMSASQIVDEIVAIKTLRAGYTGSDAEKIITQTLTQTDRTALEARIAAADTSLAEIEEANGSAVKDSYLSTFEDLLKEDLTVKFNIDDAKKAYENLLSKVEITDADGELYTRFTAAYAELKKACEDYETAEINAVNELLKTEYTKYSLFRPVRDRYAKIDMAYLLEENATVKAAYDELTEKITKHAFYYVSATNIAEVEQGEKGLYTEQSPTHPTRLNYNEKLSMTDGLTVVVELTEAAYYNDNTKANNLCFNFLGAPNSYKGGADAFDGITVMIWLYPTESNVQIMNRTDTVIEQQSIATPMDGDNITFGIKYGPYTDIIAGETYDAYQITVNSARFVLTEAQLTKTGQSVYKDCYFSMGSFADDRTNPNCLTLVSVNGKSFAYVAPEKPEEPDDNEPEKPGTEEPEKPAEPTPEKKKCGCGSAVGGPVAVAASAALLLGAAVLVARRKRVVK